MVLGDGLLELKAHISTGEVARLIEATARWVDPETFAVLPVWYPEYARGKLLYNADWSVARRIKKQDSDEVADKKEGNTQANIALCKAMGVIPRDRPHWSCCHIWSVDDPSFVRRNTVVKDHRFFTCVANMVLLPAPLKAFTDVMPEIKAMLRACSAILYGWECDHPDLAASGRLEFDRADFPKSWESSTTVPGVIPINDKIRRNAETRKKRIKRDLEHSGKFYPREEVREALNYWKVSL